MNTLLGFLRQPNLHCKLPQSYVDNKLKHKHVDVLYRTEFDNKPGYFYILSEHQTQPDKKMPLRIMQYILRIIEHHQKQFHTHTNFHWCIPLLTMWLINLMLLALVF